jgi:dUTP pyrophosphatase
MVKVEQINLKYALELAEEQRQDYILFCFKNQNVFNEIDLEMHTGFDLATAKQVEVKEGETTLVPTGVKWVAPKGYYLSIVPRSGISLHTPIRLANAPATIESSYRGDISFLVSLANREYVSKFVNYKGIKRSRLMKDGIYKVLIPENTRLGQCLIHKTIFAQPINNIFYVIDEELYNTLATVFQSKRGEKGYGSTGV